MKPWYTSRTIWFNVVYVVLMALGTVLSGLGYDSFQPSPEVVEIAGVLLAIINVVLRRLTTQPIGKP